jgi:hypothetical protein
VAQDLDGRAHLVPGRELRVVRRRVAQRFLGAIGDGGEEMPQ